MKNVLKRLSSLFILFIVIVLILNYYILKSSEEFIKENPEDIVESYTVIVLGAKVYDDGALSTYLQNRVNGALELYKMGKVKRFLLSGDHGQEDYDEVNTMKKYLNENEVPDEDIFLDHAGFNTYNTMVRASKVFKVKDCIIVSQDYHLPRAVFIANKVGLEAQGYSSSSDKLPTSTQNKGREVLARVKSFFEVIFNLEPTFLGEEHPITGDSSTTYDKS